MNVPLVSVIIPVYNAAEYLNESLISILNQTYTNIEVIAVNDGSSDNSLEILQNYEGRIKLIEQSNQGQCAALNSGLKYALGDYIKFFDADDLMNPEHIELQVNRLNGRTDAIASCEWGRFYDGNPLSAKFNPESVWRDIQSITWLKSALSQKTDMMGGCLWLIPRNILEKAGGWDERLSLNNDFEFSTRLLLQTKDVLFTSGAKIFYRTGQGGNLANTKSEKAYQAALLSTHLGCSYLLRTENTREVRLLCANRYQEWAYRIYPLYPDLIRQIETRIDELGGSSKKMDGGKIFKLLELFCGWKIAKRIQLLFYKLGYAPRGN
jgi:Glycosyltransferases involved in cell wall biogenesis